MFAPGLPPALRRAVCLVQSFNRCNIVRDVCKSSQCQAFSRIPEKLEDDVKKPRPKTVPIPKITLVMPDNSITVTELETAQRLAKRRNLALVKIEDETKVKRAKYKLISDTDFVEEGSPEDAKSVDKTTEKDKNFKLLYISTKIAEHDLQTKIRNMMKLLNKGNKVKICITLDSGNGDKIQKFIEDAVKNDGKIQRVPSKKNTILLLIRPLIKDESTSVNNKDESSFDS